MDDRTTGVGDSDRCAASGRDADVTTQRGSAGVVPACIAVTDPSPERVGIDGTDEVPFGKQVAETIAHKDGQAQAKAVQDAGATADRSDGARRCSQPVLGDGSSRSYGCSTRAARLERHRCGQLAGERPYDHGLLPTG